MNKEIIKEIKELAKRENAEISIYAWTVDSRYRKGIHTDSIEYINGTMSNDLDFNFKGEFEFDFYELMDEEELNRTVYANDDDSAERKEIVVMVERTE